MTKELEEKLIKTIDILVEQNFMMEAKIIKLEAEIRCINEELGVGDDCNEVTRIP